MATMKLVPSQLNNAASSYLTISDQDNMYADTSSSTYATITNTNASTSNRYIYLKGFNFDDIPANAQVNSWTVRLKGYYTGGSQQTLYLCNNTTTQSGATATGLTTSTQTRTFSNGSLTWDTIKSWGNNFGIRINCRRGNRNTTAYYYIYGAEIEVDYSMPATITSTLTGNGTIDPSGATAVYAGETYTLTITPDNASDTVSATKDGIPVTLTEHTGGTAERYPASYTTGGSINGTRYQNTIGHSVANPSSSTGSDYFSTTQGGSGSTWIEYAFNFSDIPSGATITSVSVQVRGHAEDISQSRQIATVQLYSGSTAKGSSLELSSNSDANYTLSNVGTWTATELHNAKLRFTIGVYGGLLTGVTWTVTYTAPKYYTYSYTVDGNATIAVTIGSVTPVSVTGVSLDHHTASVEEGSTYQLTATVSPSNATNKTVTWSSNNTSAATVSNTGLVTAVAPGTATITVTTQDGGFTDTCVVTVTEIQRTEYIPANNLVPGKKYLLANANTGSVYLLSNQSGGSRQLVGVSATVTNGKIYLTASEEALCSFTCVEYTAGNSVTTTLQESGGKYLYSDNSSGLRFNTVSTLDRFWHYKDVKFWQFKNSSSDGYSDTSTEYKYYLELNNSNNYTDNHVTSPSIEDSTIPAMYLFRLNDGASDELYVKNNGSWAQVSEAYKKVNGAWVLQSDISAVFQQGVNYRKGGN